jgi:fructose-1,6-bisphosphatase-3
MEHLDKRYLLRLSELYPTIAAASTEIINLSSIMNLPKGTEHFITDVHGEYESFSHVLRNGSGAVRKKINEVFGRTLPEKDIRELATLIYYPTEKIALVKKEITDPEEMDDWYKVMLYRLVEVCKYTASKYSRSKIRKAMPKDFAYVIEELITDDMDGEAFRAKLLQQTEQNNEKLRSMTQNHALTFKSFVIQHISKKS